MEDREGRRDIKREKQESEEREGEEKTHGEKKKA